MALMQGVLLCLQPSRKSVKYLVGFKQILLHRHFKITPHRLNENCVEILKQPLTPISSMFVNQCVCVLCVPGCVNAWVCVSFNYLECSLIYTCLLCVLTILHCDSFVSVSSSFLQLSRPMQNFVSQHAKCHQVPENEDHKHSSWDA